MISEAEWEEIALERLSEHGWDTLHGNQVAPGADGGRTSWGDVVLHGRLLAAMRKLNPLVPSEYVEQALAEIVALVPGDAITNNYRLHQILVHGYRGISYVDSDGIEQNPTIRLLSHLVEDNEQLAVNQVIVRSKEVERRFDVVLYLNGMPVVLVELKKAGAAQADLASAYAQIATYLDEFPMAFRFCVLSVISDGITARYGTPFTPLNHYSPWNVDDDGRPMRPTTDVTDTSLGIELEYLVDGVCNPERFLQLQRNFVAFDAGAEGYAKRVAKPHQYFAVTKAVGSTVAAAASNGKAGVVWHTQGSGKSMEMELYAHLVAAQPKLKNPTLVVVTDRTELDSQLFETFNRSTLLAEAPVKITGRGQLRTSLTDRKTGGIYFTTLQKFGLTETLDEVCAGYSWRKQLLGDTKSWIKAAVGLTNHLRSPSTPGSQVADGEETLGQRFRKLSNQHARAWALAAGTDTLADLRPTARFYEEVRVWMGKFDAQERQASGEPVPEEIHRLLAGLVASSTATGEIVDIYEAAGLPKPSLSDLGPEFTVKAQQAENPHLAIEALRDLLTEESAAVTRNNLVRQRAFSERIKELMNRYTNQQLTSAEVIAELIEMAKEVATEGNRGQHFTPPLSEDELAFYDAVSTNQSAVMLQGEDVLARIARELVEVIRRDVKTDWMVRDDVRAKLRSSIKRLLIKYKYPPDKQPEAIRLVIEQMEAMAPRYTA